MVGAFLVLVLIVGLVYWVGERRPLPKEGLTLNATVKLVPLEGGCWVLDTNYGEFLASGLPKEFKVNGLKVTAKIRLAESQAHFCPMGRGIVVVSSIARSGT